MRPAYLLAARLSAGIGRIQHRDQQFIQARLLQRIRNIKSEAVVAAAVTANLLAVDGNGCLEIYGAEIQNNASSAPRGWQLKLAPVPQSVIFTHRLHDT